MGNYFQLLSCCHWPNLRKYPFTTHWLPVKWWLSIYMFTTDWKETKGRFFNWRPHYRRFPWLASTENTNAFLAYIAVKLYTAVVRSHPKPRWQTVQSHGTHRIHPVKNACSVWNMHTILCHCLPQPHMRAMLAWSSIHVPFLLLSISCL